VKLGAYNWLVLATSRATQLLAVFLAVVSSLPDAEAALDAGVEGAALALEAQVAAAVCGGRALTSVAIPRTRYRTKNWLRSRPATGRPSSCPPPIGPRARLQFRWVL